MFLAGSIRIRVLNASCDVGKVFRTLKFLLTTFWSDHGCGLVGADRFYRICMACMHAAYLLLNIVAFDVRPRGRLMARLRYAACNPFTSAGSRESISWPFCEFADS